MYYKQPEMEAFEDFGILEKFNGARQQHSTIVRHKKGTCYRDTANLMEIESPHLA